MGVITPTSNNGPRSRPGLVLQRTLPLDRSLSALLAVRNVQCTLRTTVLEMLDLMSELTNRFELVLIDDCSTDATIEVADELAAVYPQLFVLRHETPRGYWNSIRSALERSLGEWILLGEEDRLAAWDQMSRLWVAAGEHDLVVGRPIGCAQGGRAPEEIVSPSGGYLLGRRHLLVAAIDSLGNWPEFSARLQMLGARWLEVAISMPAWHRWRLPKWARVAPEAGVESVACRLRPDGPESAPAKPVFHETACKKSLSPAERHLYPAAELLE